MSRLLTHGSEYRRLTVMDDSDDGVSFQVFTHDVHTQLARSFLSWMYPAKLSMSRLVEPWFLGMWTFLLYKNEQV